MIDTKYQIISQSKIIEQPSMSVFLNVICGMRYFHSDLLIYLRIAIICQRIKAYQNSSVHRVTIQILLIITESEFCHKNKMRIAQYLISPDQRKPFFL
jgi:hypothetical protein